MTSEPSDKDRATVRFLVADLTLILTNLTTAVTSLTTAMTALHHERKDAVEPALESAESSIAAVLLVFQDMVGGGPGNEPMQ